ncbi:MAG TPA: hypothetical protein VED87_03230, partial [Methylocystis sp.]|nr:hypothetical protein [Methylocystis sp.]
MQWTDEIYCADNDYRLSSHLHQNFYLVLFERELNSVKAWPLVLDEALRLLAPGGVLVLRMRNLPVLSIWELKNFLMEWGERRLTIVFERRDGGAIEFAIRNDRAQRRSASLATFAFGVISDGRQPARVEAFIDSVLAFDNPRRFRTEIFVCGPTAVADQISRYGDGVSFIEEPERFKELGWITKKKNLIVERATS